MKLSVSLFLLAAANVDLSTAFTSRLVSTTHTQNNNSRRPQQQPKIPFLFATSTSTTEQDRIKKVGGGIALDPAGNNCLFDPSTDGKISSAAERISSGFQYEFLPVEAPVHVPEDLDEAQHFLEHVTGEPFAKATQPVQATVLGRVPLIRDDAPGDIQHVLLQLPEGMHYLEGQSLSVIPPGTDQAGKPHKPRLYSIASTRYGELLDGSTVSLCVRRSEYTDPETGDVDPAKAGVCSNYLCDVTPGEQVLVAGPVGKSMLMPQDPSRDLILVATGTGIAPYRGFLRRLFAENTVARHMFTGHAWLILGVPVTGGLLYADEFNEMKEQHPDKFDVTYAISREMMNRNGGKFYVQHVLMEHADTVLDRLDKGAHIYFCGLKGMMPGILDALEMVATQRGIDWKDYLSTLKKNNQWHVEVY
ncbi:hypothetical protein ACA910_015437 [Epithemia clementina (nom. ined.)]